MKTFVKHRPPSNTGNPRKSRLLMPPRSSLWPSSSSGASSPVPSGRVPSPAPLCFKMHLLRLHHTVPLSQMHPPNSRSQSSFLDASTPMTRWIDSLLFLRMGTLVAPHFPIPSTWIPLSVSAVPVVVTFAFLSRVRSSTAHHRRHQDSSINLPWVLLMESLSKQRPCDPVRNLLLLLPRQVRQLTSTSTPSSQPQVSTTQVGTHSARSTLAHKRSAITALAETHSAVGADPRAGRGSFPKPRPVVLPMVSFGQPKPAGLGHIHNADSDFTHHSISSLHSSMESRPSAQESHSDHSCHLRTFSRS